MIRPFPQTHLLSAIEQLVDDRVGVVGWIKEFPRDSGGPEFFHYYAEACNAAAFGGTNNSRCSGGASTSRLPAIGKAFGEAVERYCSAFYDWRAMPFASFEQATFQCVSPHEFALYSPEQTLAPGFAYIPFEYSTPIHWTAAADPLTGQQWYVPAAMVHVPYSFDDHAGEGHIVQRMSTGLACHCSPEEAALSAICEVVERDAFTLTWQARMGMPSIRPESLDEATMDLLNRFQREGCQVQLFHLKLDHAIPTVLSVFRGQSIEAPALAFAAASSLSPRVALRKSLEELAHTLRLAHELKVHLPPFAPASDFGNVETQDDHVHVYCDRAHAQFADFLLAAPPSCELQSIPDLSNGDPRKDLDVALTEVLGIGHRTLLVDVTTPDVREAGLSVIRAVIPGFHPLFIGHRRRALGGNRLWEIPQKLGYEGISRLQGDNPTPHPFP